MANHFRSIGFPVDSPGQLNWLAETAARAGTAAENDECTYVAAGMPDGGQLWVQVNKQNEIVGCAPHFHGDAEMRVRIGGARRGIETALEGSLLVWSSPEQATEGRFGLFPFLVDVPDFWATAVRLPIGQIVDLRIAAFAHDLRCFPNESALQTEGGPYAGFAPQCFIPSGLMQPDGSPRTPPEAIAIASGIIRSGETIRNPVTQEEFLHLLIDTLGGSLDVVAENAVVHGEPVVAGIVLGRFWLSARVARLIDVPASA